MISTFLTGLLLQLEVFAFNKLILHRKFVLLSHAPMGTEVLDSILDILGLLEAVGCGYLIIKIDLLLIEDEDAASCDHVPLKIHKVSSSVHQASILVVKLAIGGL